MRKLALKIDDLTVETFHVGSESSRSGTVIAAEFNSFEPCTQVHCTQVGVTCYSCAPCVSDTGNCLCTDSRHEIC